MNRRIQETKNVSFLILFLIGLVFIASCKEKISDDKLEIYSTKTQTLTQTPTIRISETLDTKTLLTKTPYLNQTPVPTLTPLSTLTKDEASTLVLSLLEENAGCDLPCWWGAIPGRTKWNKTQQYLNSFVIDIEQGQVNEVIEFDKIYDATNYLVRYDIQQYGEGRTLYNLLDNTIESILVYPPGTNLKYQIHDLLNRYGKPQEVTIHTYSHIPFDHLPFRLFLYYPAQGIFAYYDYEAKVEDDFLVGCMPPIGPELFLWNPERNLSIKDIEYFMVGVEHQKQSPKSISDVTDINIDDFYDQFKTPERSRCIKTLKDFWP